MALPSDAQAILRLAGLRNENSQLFSIDREIIQSQRALPYAQMWTLANSKRWFHIQLEDLSIFQFQIRPSPSFHFMECPLEIPTYADFLSTQGVDYRERNNPIYLDQYQEVIDTASLKLHITPMRYDYDSNAYRAGVHPAAHLHIGLNNQIRLRLSREMNARAFLLFVIRHRYPEAWYKLINSTLRDRLEKYVRSGLLMLSDRYKKAEDSYELSLD